MNKYKFTAALFLQCILFSCNKYDLDRTNPLDPKSKIGETVTDIDGNVYNTIAIGTQVWMKENLKTSKYRNGDVVTTGLNNSDWIITNAGACAIYNNDNANNFTYGKLYNWYAVVDSRNICPTGWHVPTDADWKVMEINLGMTRSEVDATGWRGSNQGAQIKNITGWSGGYININTSGFSALPGGTRYFLSGGTYTGMGSGEPWWTATASSSTSAYHRYVGLSEGNISRFGDNDKKNGFAVRCVKGESTGGTIPTKGLVAYYPLNGNANDESGNGHNGTPIGVTPVNDRFGNSSKAYLFNGTSNIINFGDFHPTVNEFSISIWFNAKTFSNQRMLISDATTFSGFYLDAYSDAIYFGTQFNIVNNVTTFNHVWVNSNLNQWHHVVGTSLNGTLKIYYDGILTSTNTGSIGTIGTGILAAGYDKTNSSYYFQGSLDDIRIYNRILTDAEIQSLYYEGGWW